ncbi:hypothetical protein CR105_10190 [Massilia eurypsychrophila]|uniref:DUF1640 domain-containing protein n=1 Tax=Massilia eurypsychrophila TaxID=1485217 RepID=A0A2G8TFM3_9BURK|nr:hypothetical protein [Massilia eurypsychrophila]PIL44850.1 hypothetical protein CR105_10190 [Massilia eurypsychrophila]
MNHDSRSFEDDLSSLKADLAVVRSNYVTKADLQEVRLELKAEIQDGRLEMKAIEANLLSRIDAVRVDDIYGLKIELKSEISALGTELRSDISALRVDNEKLRGEMKAMLAVVQKSLNAQTWRIIGTVSSLVAVVFFIVRAGY